MKKIEFEFVEFMYGIVQLKTIENVGTFVPGIDSDHYNLSEIYNTKTTGVVMRVYNMDTALVWFPTSKKAELKETAWRFELTSTQLVNILDKDWNGTKEITLNHYICPLEALEVLIPSKLFMDKNLMQPDKIVKLKDDPDRGYGKVIGYNYNSVTPIHVRFNDGYEKWTIMSNLDVFKTE